MLEKNIINKILNASLNSQNIKKNPRGQKLKASRVWAELGPTGLSIPEDLKHKLVDKFLRMKRQRDYDQQQKSSKLINNDVD